MEYRNETESTVYWIATKEGVVNYGSVQPTALVTAIYYVLTTFVNEQDWLDELSLLGITIENQDTGLE